MDTTALETYRAELIEQHKQSVTQLEQATVTTHRLMGAIAAVNTLIQRATDTEKDLT